MVFEEARQSFLVVQSCLQVFTDRSRMAVAQPVVQAFVVGVIEALLLQHPLEIPIHLCQEQEVREALSNAPDRPRPEWLRPPSPRPLEHLRQQEHRHVAAHAVTLSGNLHQCRDHRPLRRGIAVVELQRIRPAREERIAPVRQNHVTFGACNPRVVLRRALEIGLSSGNVSTRGRLVPTDDRARCDSGRSRAST